MMVLNSLLEGQAQATKMFACVSLLSCVLSKSLTIFLNCQHSEVCKFK